MAVVDLEAFGLYQPPTNRISADAQVFGLEMMRNPVLCDFSIKCWDGQSVACCARLLEQRWPWFATEYASHQTKSIEQNSSSQMSQLVLPEAYPVILAFVQYLYTMSLITPLQQDLPILAALLTIGQTYKLPQLIEDVKHAMHSALNVASAPPIYEMATFYGLFGLQLRSLKLVLVSPIHFL